MDSNDFGLGLVSTEASPVPRWRGNQSGSPRYLPISHQPQCTLAALPLLVMLVQAGPGLRAGLRTAAWRDAVLVAGDGERVAVHRIGAAQISSTADLWFYSTLRRPRTTPWYLTILDTLDSVGGGQPGAAAAAGRGEQCRGGGGGGAAAAGYAELGSQADS